jgi:hypothetical protein
MSFIPLSADGRIDGGILIYVPNRGQVETETFESFLELAVRVLVHPRAKDVPIGVSCYTGDSLVPRARNECSGHFRTTTAEAMLFVDSDIVFDPEHVFALWDTGLPLVGANYHVSRRSTRTSEERGVVVLRDDAPLIARVDRLPTGFMMIRRTVLDRLAEAAPTYTNDNGDLRHEFFRSFTCDKRYLSEDFGFTELAVRAGFVPHLHQGVELGHIGRTEWRLPTAKPM